MDTEKLKRYFSDELGWGWSPESQLAFAFLVNVAEKARGGVVLDAGAGHQRYKPFFEESIYIAQEHPEAGIKNKGIARFDILCDVKQIPLESNSVDYILSTSSLEHMEFPELFFPEAFRVLKPGGELFIHVPFIHGEHEVPYDFQRPTRYGLQRWYRHAGFEEIDVKPASSSITTITTLLKLSVFEHYDGVRKELKRGGLRAAKLGALIVFNSVVIKPFCKLMVALFDGMPHATRTMYPIGWLATAKKPGVLEKRPLPEKLAFLQQRMLPSGAFVFADDAIRPAC